MKFVAYIYVDVRDICVASGEICVLCGNRESAAGAASDDTLMQYSI